MAYHTALALEAGRPAVVTVGRRVFRARPLSVPTMLALLAAVASGDPVRLVHAEAACWRAAFPRPTGWRRVLWWRDPLRSIARLPVPLRRAILERLCRRPSDAPPKSAPLSARERLAAKQRAARGHGASTDGPQPTLLLAAQACRAAFGESWYYDPRRWGTSDGYVPHDVCWLEFDGLSAVDARAQLVLVQAQAVAHSGKHAREALRSLVRTAFPADPLTAAPRGGFVH